MDWTDLERHHVALARPLLLVRAKKGVVACGYLSLEAAAKNGDVAATVTGVSNFEELVEAKLVGVSPKAEEFGLRIGQRAGDALEALR